MTPLCISCASCHRSWALSVDDSLYLELDLASRPCPHCEAYTLNCPGRAAAAPPRQRHRAPHGLRTHASPRHGLLHSAKKDRGAPHEKEKQSTSGGLIAHG